MSDIDIKIDINKIQNQVKNEVLKEQKYWRENDAKMRAIEQRVPTYEDFRQLVLGSHLKPLDKGESLVDGKGEIATKKVWNTMAPSSESESLSSPINSENQANYVIFDNKPKNSLEFVKIWAKLEASYNNDSKLSYLKNLGNELLQKIFKPEINGDLLGKFLVLFDEQLKVESIQKEKCDFIVEVMKIFINCNRFKLNLMFLKDSELSACKNVLSFFKNDYENKFKVQFSSEDIEHLSSSYLN